MSSPKIETDTPHVQAPEVNATVQAKPAEVASFRAALAGSGAVRDGLASDDDMASSDEVVAFADAQLARVGLFELHGIQPVTIWQ